MDLDLTDGRHRAGAVGDHRGMPASTSRRHSLAVMGVSTAALVMALLGGVLAADLPKLEARRVQDVIESQLKAFAADDAHKAFSLAAPDIRSKFGSAEQFLAMVRAQYPMVHRPASVLFLKPESDGDMAFQRVRMTDTEGAGWLVTYLLNRQKDGQWRISACLVVPDGARLRT